MLIFNTHALRQMIGCQPSQSAVMSASVKAGKILDIPSGDTLSDGTAGGIEENPVSLQYIILTYMLLVNCQIFCVP